jgi:hypothetical protein
LELVLEEIFCLLGSSWSNSVNHRIWEGSIFLYP